MERINLYSKSNCQPCRLTESLLAGEELYYQKHDVADDPDTRLQVEALGYRTVPVVTLEDEVGNITEHWQGFRPDKIRQLGGRALKGQIWFNEHDS